MPAVWKGARPRHPMMSVALSAAVPGLGHMPHARPRAYAIMAASATALAAAAISVLSRPRHDLLEWSLSLPHLYLAVDLSIALLAARLIIGADAYRSAKKPSLFAPKPRLKPMTAAAIAALLVFTAAPHVIAIRYVHSQISLLSEVFVPVDTETAYPTPGPAPAAAPPVVSTPQQPEVPKSQPAEHQAPTAQDPPEPSPSAAPPPIVWDGPERITVALLGSDEGYDRYGIRTDVIMVVSTEVATGATALFSIPRNWRRMPFPHGTPPQQRWSEGYPGIANEIYGLGHRHPDLFPGVEDPSGHAAKLSLAELLGIPVHYYAILDMQGFVEAVDLFGGIDIYVRETVTDSIKPLTKDGPKVAIDVNPGTHRLDGLSALGYVRSRRASSDYSRMTRQRCVIEAMVDQSSPLEILINYPALAGIISSHVRTDIPLSRLSELLSVYRSVDTSNVVTVNFIPPEFPRGDAPIRQVRAAVVGALQGTDHPTNAALAASCAAPR